MTTETYDAIMLLGGGINIDGSLTEAAKLQVQKAVELYNLYSPHAIITCGLYGYKNEKEPPISEARAYARYAETLGINQSKIYLEERSQETLGNLLFAKMSILIPHTWTRIIIVPGKDHLTERVAYLAQKVFGPTYTWKIVRAGENLDERNVAREKKALELTKGINNALRDGDHDTIYAGLLATHPAYGGTRWTTEELRKLVGYK